MTILSDIIEIQITRETAAVAQTNFNVPLFISAHSNFTERARVYSSLTAVAEDFTPGTPAYIAAQRLFGQQIRPTNIVLGRRLVPSVQVLVTEATVGASYTVDINGQTYTYIAITADTPAKIATGLKAAYDVSPQAGVTVVDNLDGSLTISGGDGVAVKVTGSMSKTDAPATESMAAALTAVQAENDTWYVVMAESHLEVDVLNLAAAVEAMTKVYAMSSSQVSIKASGTTTDLFSKLKDLGYQRTFGLWSATADTEYPEAAWVGYQLQEQPGSNTWAYKTLSGVTVSSLSQSESQAIQAKSGSTYERVGGLNVTCGAKMFGGEWIDVMIFVDWLEQRMKERLWFRMANSKKIPYTAAGASIIEAEIRAQLNDGIRVGGLSDDPTPRVTVPDILTMSPNMRAQRIFEGIEFEARLAGAIHFVKVKGVVTV